MRKSCAMNGNGMMHGKESKSEKKMEAQESKLEVQKLKLEIAKLKRELGAKRGK
jgi:hypothetical protein